MTSFSVGDSVRFKDGTQHADLPQDIGGWQGRIIQLNAGAEHLVEVQLDSLTLQSLGELYILDSELEGVSWRSYVDDVGNLELWPQRDSPKDVENTYETLLAQHNWIYSDSGSATPEQYEQWQLLWQNYAAFPFKAVVDDAKGTYSSHVPGGSRVRVLGFAQTDDQYGLIVDVKYKFSRAKLPLVDVKATDHSSVQHRLLEMYQSWFAVYS